VADGVVGEATEIGRERTARSLPRLGPHALAVPEPPDEVGEGAARVGKAHLQARERVEDAAEDEVGGGDRGVERVAELHDPRDVIVHGKKRFSSFRDTDLEFVLRRRLGVDTVILAGINTTTCVLCAGFEATNRDFRVVIAADAVDSMDGEDMHRWALRLMAAAIGWPLPNADILAAFSA